MFALDLSTCPLVPLHLTVDIVSVQTFYHMKRPKALTLCDSVKEYLHSRKKRKYSYSSRLFVAMVTHFFLSTLLPWLPLLAWSPSFYSVYIFITLNSGRSFAVFCPKTLPRSSYTLCATPLVTTAAESFLSMKSRHTYFGLKL